MIKCEPPWYNGKDLRLSRERPRFDSPPGTGDHFLYAYVKYTFRTFILDQQSKQIAKRWQQVQGFIMSWISDSNKSHLISQLKAG